MKKILSIVIVSIFILVSSIPLYATEKNIINDKSTKSTSQFLVSITRPEGDESTFKKSYVICGNSRKEDILVKLLTYNKNTDSYEEYENTDGDSCWSIGSSGVFMKEIQLPKEGANLIRIVAYNKYADTLKINENLQVSNFTITLLNKSVKDAIKNGFFRITDILNEYYGYVKSTV